MHLACADRDSVAIGKGNLETIISCAERHVYILTYLGSSVNSRTVFPQAPRSIKILPCKRVSHCGEVLIQTANSPPSVEGLLLLVGREGHSRIVYPTVDDRELTPSVDGQVYVDVSSRGDPPIGDRRNGRTLVARSSGNAVRHKELTAFVLKLHVYMVSEFGSGVNSANYLASTFSTFLQ